MPTTYLLISIIAMLALHFVVPIVTVVPPPIDLVGVLLVLLGLGVNIWASNLFNKKSTTVKPFEESTYFINGGLYRFSRHPMYLGMAVLLLGIALLLRSITPFLVLPIFAWLVTRNFIKPEEKAMEETFGDAYREYKQRVRRWL
jgi:protein-S-isoprenylcysteine O-methyltransferase Ste14